MNVLKTRRLSLHRLSTPRGRQGGRHRQDSRVACTDDIHTPVENNESPHRSDREKSKAKPPGLFVSNDLEEQTARFLEEVKDLAKRRKDLAAKERDGPPPLPREDQRSRRL